MSITPSFSGEVQLAGWSESHNGGCKVVLWLADSTDLDAFRAMTVRKGNVAGQRLACVLVEIGDDETPVEPAPAPAPKRERMGPLCEWAVFRCEEELFQRWVEREAPNMPQLAFYRMQQIGFKTPAEKARAFILAVANVKSRKDLDTDPGAAIGFKTEVVGPYAAWVKKQGVAA